eukprot:71195-Chlamydomonas_euryale.AAC.2
MVWAGGCTRVWLGAWLGVEGEGFGTACPALPTALLGSGGLWHCMPSLAHSSTLFGRALALHAQPCPQLYS